MGGVLIIAVMTTLMAMMGVMIGVICKLTLIQERRNLFMGVPIRDCRKLEIEDVWMPQPILHHIFVYLFFCADKPCNLCNGNVPTWKTLEASVFMEKLIIDVSSAA